MRNADMPAMQSTRLKVFSGECCLCDVGIPTGFFDISGKPLSTGDIVLVYYGRYIGTELEEWTPKGGLTVIVVNQYQSYTNGALEIIDGEFEPFAMGIKSQGFNHDEWQIHRVKAYSDVLEGENWPDFGFSYKKDTRADALLAELEKTS